MGILFTLRKTVTVVSQSLDSYFLSICKLVGLLGAHKARLNNHADTNSVKDVFQSKLKLQPKRKEGEKKNVEEYYRSRDSRNFSRGKKDKYPLCGICNKSSHAEKDS